MYWMLLAREAYRYRSQSEGQNVKVKCEVIMILDQPAEKSAIRDYIRQAVGSYGGQFHSSSPFFSTKIKAIPGKIEKMENATKLKKA
jgi:hypothetical protein